MSGHDAEESRSKKIKAKQSKDGSDFDITVNRIKAPKVVNELASAVEIALPFI
jgi:hypothetical protein